MARKEVLTKKYGLENIYEYVFGTYCNEGGDPFNYNSFEEFIKEEESWINMVRDFYQHS